MAIIRFYLGESGRARTGDVVFSYKPGIEWPLHAGVHVGVSCDVTTKSLRPSAPQTAESTEHQAVITTDPTPPSDDSNEHRSIVATSLTTDASGSMDRREPELNRPPLLVCGIPRRPREEVMGIEEWGGKHRYRADILGARLDVDEIKCREVALLAEAVATIHAQLGADCCHWAEKAVINPEPLILGRHPAFICGSCTQFVEYLYEQVGLDLILQKQIYDPADPERIYPATQIRAFWAGEYPLECSWEPSLATYDACCQGVEREQWQADWSEDEGGVDENLSPQTARKNVGEVEESGAF